MQIMIFIARDHSMEGLDDSLFWFPFSDVEPELPDEVLRTIGRLHWLRRSRLVAREYNFLDTREDVYAPPSSSICNRYQQVVASSDYERTVR